MILENFVRFFFFFKKNTFFHIFQGLINVTSVSTQIFTFLKVHFSGFTLPSAITLPQVVCGRRLKIKLFSDLMYPKFTKIIKISYLHMSFIERQTNFTKSIISIIPAIRS